MGTLRLREVLLSNDYGFIERATDAGVPAQHLTFPVDVSQSTRGSWMEATEFVHYFTIRFGVLTPQR